MKKRKRLLWQIYPSYLFITLISLVAVTWYASGALRSFYLGQTAADLEARATLLEKSIIPVISPLNAEKIDQICKDIGARADTRLTVILPSGKVIGDSLENPKTMDNHGSRPEIKAALHGEVGVSTRYSKTLGKNMMYVSIPLKHQDRISAVIRTSFSVSSIDQTLHAIQIKILAGGILIAIFAAGISLLISRKISHPLEEMKRGAQKFAQGDLRHQLATPDTEELARLAEAMNQMARQLDDRIQAVRQQRNELETVLSNMVEGVVAVDLNDHILSVNQAAASMFESTAPDLLGQSIQETIRNHDLQKFISEAILTGKSDETDIIFYQKEERILHSYSNPLRDPKGEHIGVLIVLDDVTQLRKLENIRRDFVANVSHELKTPLTAIKGFVETLNHGAIENREESSRFLGIIEKHVDRLNFIIDDLLKLSKIESDHEKNKIKIENQAVYDVVMSAVHFCRPYATQKGISIDVECEPSLRSDLNPSLMEQALINLLENAIRYSDKKKPIEIMVSQNHENTTIQIRDHGIGIAPEDQNRLFERFYRVDKARSRKLGGTGLGLAIVKHIVQAHQGKVSLESSVGEGSTFTILLQNS
ncbi:MAG: cell wall metabolism sensor histidine kinase WalK [Desulfobacterales bacterium]|nr:cell wall metabolism sensor histidine kinase WalK [Desulfobacterales bacterium]